MKIVINLLSFIAWEQQ